MAIGRQSLGGDEGEGYAATSPPGWTEHRESGDASGALRMKRVGERTTTYYRAGDRWRRLSGFERSIGAPGGVGPSALALQVFSLDERFAHLPVRVAFDNFSIAADELSCD
jgi:hypothetical protein